MELLPLTTGLIALLTTMLTGVFRSVLDRAKAWHPLAVQSLVLVVSLAVTAAAHYIGLVPETYQGLLSLVLQAVVGALGAVGINNVKDGVKYGSAGAVSDERIAASTETFIARKNPGAEE